MKHLHRARELDMLSRFALLSLLILIVYIGLICVLFPILMGERTFFSDVLLDMSEPEHVHLNLIAVLFSLIIGVVGALVTRPVKECAEKGRILTDVLSKDEQQLVDIVREAGEITQDSLVFRLGWSRPKVSTLLTNLERMNIVQRRREGKTYVIIAKR